MVKGWGKAKPLYDLKMVVHVNGGAPLVAGIARRDLYRDGVVVVNVGTDDPGREVCGKIGDVAHQEVAEPIGDLLGEGVASGQHLKDVAVSWGIK